MLCRIQPRRWPAVLLGLGEMLVAGGGNLSAEFVRVEGGFQNFVLGHVFPEAETPTSTLVMKVGVEVCAGRAWQPSSLNSMLYLEFLA